ncbi:hypothetical protein OE88DRAFT_1652812 [Heliocybe sulcata]|uniref:AMP-activated protein kinase glycogen-binding domain-containing protein n=1 Tax=Heliocybe sulcata TaxID=5364 RepID=A0A5C3NFS6_9AGAM|nr:hypothetical protein OE88DRAFT_1652812 [Heliocybe sulcata]
MADFHEATFRWSQTDASDVICTGTFDQWSSSIHLNKTPTGFESKIKVPWSETILYKFVVDGNWTTASDQPTEYDATGNLNNVYHAPSKPAPPVLEAPPAVLAPESVAPEPKLANGDMKRESGSSIVEKVTEMASNVVETASNAVAPAVEFADKFVDEPATPAATDKPQEPLPEEPAAPAEPEAVSSPAPEPPAPAADPELLPEVPLVVLPLTDQAATPTAEPTQFPTAPNIPDAPTIPPPEPLETLLVPGAAVNAEKKDEATEEEVQPSTHTGGVADAIAAPLAEIPEDSSTPPPVPPKVNGNGTAKTPESSQPPTPTTSPVKSLRERHFSFPTIRRTSVQNFPKSPDDSPPSSPNGTTRLKVGERKKRTSIFGKLKDVFLPEKEKSGEKEKAGK